MITAKNLHKKYDELHVLKGVNLHIKKGEIVSIVGASGAGKTTLLQILGTLDLPSKDISTSLIINGEDILNMKDKAMSQFRNLNLGFIFQFHQLLPEFTALENVCIPGFIAKRNKNEVEQEAKKLLDFLGLSHRINHKPNELSGGEQQRIAIARALLNTPDIIIADEPTADLDSQSSAAIMHALRRAVSQGSALICITHDLDIAHSGDRVISVERVIA